MVALVTLRVELSVVPWSTCNVESIVVAPPIETTVLNDTSFSTTRVDANVVVPTTFNVALKDASPPTLKCSFRDKSRFTYKLLLISVKPFTERGYLCVTVPDTEYPVPVLAIYIPVLFSTCAEPTLKGCVVLDPVLINVYVFPL